MLAYKGLTGLQKAGFFSLLLVKLEHGSDRAFVPLAPLLPSLLTPLHGQGTHTFGLDPRDNLTLSPEPLKYSTGTNQPISSLQGGAETWV